MKFRFYKHQSVVTGWCSGWLLQTTDTHFYGINYYTDYRLSPNQPKNIRTNIQKDHLTCCMQLKIIRSGCLQSKSSRIIDGEKSYAYC